MHERPDLVPKALIPDELRQGAIANWNGHAGRFSVYRITGYQHRDGARPKELRETLGSIGFDEHSGQWKFKYGRSYLVALRIKALEEQTRKLQAELDQTMRKH